MTPEDVHLWNECRAFAKDLEIEIELDHSNNTFRIKKTLVPGATVTLSHQPTVRDALIFLRGYERGLHIARIKT